MEKRSKITHQAIQVSKWMRLSLGLLVLMLSASLAMAQLTTGNISGTVLDETGAVLPGVDVTVTNVATGIVRNTISDDEGRYAASNLAPGPYQVRAELAGFQTLVRDGIQLTAGRNAIVALVLRIGEVTTEVVVSGEAALLETSTATVSNLVTEKQVLDLPLNNRDLTSLTYLQPGVLKVPQEPRQGVFSGMGNKLSVSGARQTHNIYLTDGLTSGDISGNTAGATGGSTGVETVKEFQIITNNYSSEYKSAAGAIISMVTKSGTNQFHGSVFEFHRNDNLDASNFFDNALGQEKPEFLRNQFGGSLGGPIVPDKTFFFAAYEGLRESNPISETIRMPNADTLNGLIPIGEVKKGCDPADVRPGGLCDIGVDPVVQPFMALYPIPGQGNVITRDFGDGTVQLSGPNNQITSEDFVTVKLDHQFDSQKLGSLSGTWTLMRSDRERSGIIADISGDAEDGGAETLSSDRDSISVYHTSILSPTAVNVFRFGFSKTGPTGDIPLSKRDFSGLTFNNNSAGLMGQLEVGDFEDIGFRVNSSKYGLKVYTFADDFSLTRGNHSLKIGGLVNRWVMDQDTRSAGVQGIMTFSTLEKFLKNDLKRFETFLPSESVNLDDFDIAPGWSFTGEVGERFEHNLTQFGMGLYLQDNWMVRPSLTLNLGLRYSFVTIPKEVNGATSNLINLDDARMTIGPLFGNNPWKKSFSPRIGFAWSPGDRKTSLRAGAGIFYDFPGYYHIRTALQVSPPFILSARADNGKGAFKDVELRFPDAFFTQLDLIAGKVRPNIRPPQYQQENTYISRWSLHLQRELGTYQLVSVGYTGSRGVHLWIMERGELNKWVGWPNPVPTAEKQFVEDLGPINGNFGVLRPQIPAANSFYHGLTASLQQRFTGGLQFQLSYTLSKAIDMGSGVTSGGDNLPQGQRGIYLYGDLGFKRSLSSHDIRHNFISNFSWELPGGGLTGFAGALLGGWQINGILSLVDGHPLTLEDDDSAQDDAIGQNNLLTPNIITGGDTNPVLGGPNRYFDSSQFIPGACRGGQFCQAGDPDHDPGFFGNVGRNTLTSPGLATFDFSLAKNIEVTENTRFQFRAEFFNIFNRANFGTPETEVISSKGKVDLEAGSINHTFSTSRQIQFGLKFIF